MALDHDSPESARPDAAADHDPPRQKPRWLRSLGISIAWGAATAALVLVSLAVGTEIPRLRGLLAVAVLPAMAYAIPLVPLLPLQGSLPEPASWVLAAVWCPLAWAFWIQRWRLGRLTTIEAIFVPLFVGIMIAIITPGFLGAREKARNAECDKAFVTLSDSYEGPALGDASHSSAAEATLERFLTGHRRERNPLNRRLPRFTRANPSPCQVQLLVTATGIEVSQTPGARGRLRTYSLRIE